MVIIYISAFRSERATDLKDAVHTYTIPTESYNSEQSSSNTQETIQMQMQMFAHIATYLIGPKCNNEIFK